MAGRLGHIDGARRVGHIPGNGIRKTNYAFGFGGCEFWLDAQYGLNTYTDLAAVSSWRSKIGDYNFVQSTDGNQPRYIASNASYNNYPTVEGHDNARHMIMSQSFPLIRGKTVAFVANYTTLNTVNGVFGVNSAVVLRGGVGGSTAGTNGVFYSSGSTRTGTTEDTTVKIAVITQSRIVVNGAEEVTFTELNDDIFNQIFRAGATTASSLIGHIAEMLIFNFEMTLVECQRLSSNINSKYARY